MASILNEYISRRLGLIDLQNELQRLIKLYNTHTERYMFVYAADINKGRTRGIDVSMVQDDFYNIQDMLRESTQKKIDFYIETPGGSGEVKGQQKAVDAVELDIQCPKCGTRHKVNGYMDLNSQQIRTAKLPINPDVKDNEILVCNNCNFALDLKPIKNQVESQTKRKVSFR